MELCRAYRVLLIRIHMTHNSTQACYNGTIRGDVLYEIALCPGDHDILEQLWPGVVEKLSRTFPAIKDLILLFREGEIRCIALEMSMCTKHHGMMGSGCLREKGLI